MLSGCAGWVSDRCTHRRVPEGAHCSGSRRGCRSVGCVRGVVISTQLPRRVSPRARGRVLRGRREGVIESDQSRLRHTSISAVSPVHSHAGVRSLCVRPSVLGGRALRLIAAGVCVEFSTFLGTAVCGRARAGLRTGFGSFALLGGQSAPGHLGVAALVPLRPSGELPVRRLPAARGRYLYPPSPVSLGRLGVTRPHQFTVCYAGTEGLGT